MWFHRRPLPIFNDEDAPFRHARKNEVERQHRFQILARSVIYSEINLLVAELCVQQFAEPTDVRLTYPLAKPHIILPRTPVDIRLKVRQIARRIFNCNQFVRPKYTIEESNAPSLPYSYIDDIMNIELRGTIKFSLNHFAGFHQQKLVVARCEFMILFNINRGEKIDAVNGTSVPL
ncbi:hypothetical protein FIU92_05770 [Ruegeria sp. THAF33]|nr:hypothetical protein FIU92_05770 [Ruegeria sp. THAF33]